MVTKHRSPNYPGFDLEVAIDALAQLYSRVKRNEFTPGDAATAWGYNSTSGPVRVKMAALRQFGLLDGKKGENPKLSRSGLTFVIRNKSSHEYQEALRSAAINPPLFAKAKEAKPNASDNVLREWLLLDENFSDDGASRFVEVFRSTMRLAGLDGDDIISGLENHESLTEGEDVSMISAPINVENEQPLALEHGAPLLSAAHTRVPLKLIGGSLTVAIELPSSMTERAWKQMIDMLNALKPGYVPEAEYEPSDEPAESFSQPPRPPVDLS